MTLTYSIPRVFIAKIQQNKMINSKLESEINSNHRRYTNKKIITKD